MQLSSVLSMELKRYTYRYLHLKVISIEFESNVRESPLEKSCWAQNKDELEVCWKGCLQENRRAVALSVDSYSCHARGPRTPAADCTVQTANTRLTGLGVFNMSMSYSDKNGYRHWTLLEAAPFLKRKGKKSHWLVHNYVMLLIHLKVKSLLYLLHTEMCPLKFICRTPNPW